MPLVDANGQPISPSNTAAAFSTSALYSSGDLYGLVWNYVVGALANWAASAFLDFTAVELPIGTTGPEALLPPNQPAYLRLRFEGLRVDFEVGVHTPAETWVSYAHYDFTSSVLANAYQNLADLLTLIYNVLNAAYLGGVNVFVAGIGPFDPRGSAMAVGDVVKLSVNMRQFGSEPLQIAHHFRCADAAATFDTLETAYRTTCLPALVGAMHTSVEVLSVSIEDIINVSAPTIQRKTRTYNSAGDYPQVGTQVGGGGQNAEAPQLSVAVTWETPFAGRGERGRSFMPGLWDSASENGIATPAYIVLAQAYADSLVNNFGVNAANAPLIAGVDWVFVLWREHLSNPAIPAGSINPAGAVVRTPANPSGYEWPPVTRRPFNPRAAANGIQAAIVRDVVRTQRRRGRGVRIGRRRRVTIA